MPAGYSRRGIVADPDRACVKIVEAELAHDPRVLEQSDIRVEVDRHVIGRQIGLVPVEDWEEIPSE